MIYQKIKTFLWYDNKAEEAAEFYCSLFPDSRIISVSRFPEGSPAPAGTAMTVEFELAGIRFVALNGGPVFQFTEAISLTVDCEDQQEVDRLWDKLTDGGTPSHCGWLKDRYGLSWQIIPGILPRLLSNPDAAVAQRVMTAMLQMAKIDIATLQQAANG
ncbi:MAG: VOC family protein [Planctomycetaceae bacterium]